MVETKVRSLILQSQCSSPTHSSSKQRLPFHTVFLMCQTSLGLPGQLPKNSLTDSLSFSWRSHFPWVQVNQIKPP